MSCSANPEENLTKAISKVREAAGKGAQIVCLQELFRSLYFCDVESYDNFNLAEPIPGPSTQTLSVLAKELGVVIIASLFEKTHKRNLSQYDSRARCGWSLSWKVSKDAHPG